MDEIKKDTGEHYRFLLTVKVTEEDLKNGKIDINLDPFRISKVYKIDDFALNTVLKKALCAGNRGHKDLMQDLEDIVCAAERRIEMIKEDMKNEL